MKVKQLFLFWKYVFEKNPENLDAVPANLHLNRRCYTFIAETLVRHFSKISIVCFVTFKLVENFLFPLTLVKEAVLLDFRDI